MRKQLAVLIAATTALVLITFVVPLGILVRQFVADRAVNAATTQAQSLVGLVALTDKAALKQSVDQINATDIYPITVYLPDGTQVGAPTKPTPAVQLASRGESITVASSGGREIAVAVAGLPDGTAVIRTSVSAGQMHGGVDKAWLALGLMAAALLGLGLITGDRLVRKVIQPIADAATVSRALASGDLGARARTEGPDEVRDVSAALNQLATRIQDLIKQEREALADLSHRLRTPLAALRLEADILRSSALPGDSGERLHAHVEAVEDAITALIQQARSRDETTPAHCDAGQIVAERMAFWSVLAQDQQRPFTWTAPESLIVGVRPGDFAASIDALLGNVFAHTPERTPFTVRLTHRSPRGARLEVADQGPGFADPELLHRGGSGSGSTGLGLDIVRQTAEASGGRVTIDEEVGPKPLWRHRPRPAPAGRSVVSGASVIVEFGPPIPAGPRSS